MILAFKKLTAISALVAAAIAQDSLVVYAPVNAITCRPVQLIFGGGEPPYFLSIYPGSQLSGAPALVDFGELENSDPIRWVVNLPPGNSVFLNLLDSRGNNAWSTAFPIIAGPDTSCIGQEDSSSARPSAGTGTPPESSASASGAPSSVLLPASSTSPTSTASSASGSPTSDTAGVSTSSRPPLGPIIGAALGGLALICLIVFGFKLYRRRRSRRFRIENEADQVSVLPTTPWVATGQHPNPPNISQIPQDITSSSPFATISCNGTQASYPQPLPLTVPMSSASDLAALPSRNMNEEDPPPRYEMEPSSEVGTSASRLLSLTTCSAAPVNRTASFSKPSSHHRDVD
ncbi:hypothetical protein BKA70DRAFT_1474364 [Coprinopsis sp. MPI-PUGE-AT-0042]|nr:hypothetical protein BKA70DRAFT_1474364 [Coprinopsis sp. MPI-PUGE-AT-0042]